MCAGSGRCLRWNSSSIARSKEPAPELARSVTSRAAERGLIVISCGIYANVVRVLMPLTMSLELADEGLGILEASMLDAIAKT